MIATLALSLLAPLAGAVGTPMEPVEPAMVELFLSTEGGESACTAYGAAGEVGLLTGDPANAVMMQGMAEAYLIVQFETIWSENMGGTQRLTDEARDAYHDFLITCS